MTVPDEYLTWLANDPRRSQFHILAIKRLRSLMPELTLAQAYQMHENLRKSVWWSVHFDPDQDYFQESFNSDEPGPDASQFGWWNSEL